MQYFDDMHINGDFRVCPTHTQVKIDSVFPTRTQVKKDLVKHIWQQAKQCLVDLDLFGNFSILPI